jgi:hypothetical protein
MPVLPLIASRMVMPTQFPGAFAITNHRQRRAIPDRTSRVQVLSFCVDRDAVGKFGRNDATNQRRAADTRLNQ